jgi:hypothetical protein
MTKTMAVAFSHRGIGADSALKDSCRILSVKQRLHNKAIHTLKIHAA